jgi:hypothetical protein
MASTVYPCTWINSCRILVVMTNGTFAAAVLVVTVAVEVIGTTTTCSWDVTVGSDNDDDVTDIGVDGRVSVFVVAALVRVPAEAVVVFILFLLVLLFS